MGLVNELQDEHKKILFLYNEFATKIDESGTQERFDYLMETLKLHLEREDEGLYPVLSGCESEEVKGISAQFEESMKKITQKIMDIFEDIRKGDGSIGDSLKKKLNEIGITLKSRIVIEEYTLFPLYEKFMVK